MIVLGLNAIGHHDASACILVDGEIVAFAEEERFTRSKHALGQVPLNAMHFCLDQAGVPLHAVDYIATPWMEEEGAFSAPPGCRPEVTFDLKISDPQYADSSVFHRLFQRFSLGNLPPVAHVSHHLAHAASAFRCSGLEEASILVVDGEGDRVSTTLAHGRQGNIRLIRQFPTAFSLGQFYACITNFLGLGNMGEGKTMGLAAYGSPDAHAEFPFTLESDGYRVNLPLSGDIWDPSEVNWHTIIDAWMKVLAKSWGSPSAPVAKFDSMRGAISYDPAFERLNRDLAAAAQNALQEVLLHLAKLLIAETSCPSLVVAGGVGLNCSANGALLKLDDVETLFVQPISSDAGAPLGAALELSAQLGYGPGGRMDHTAFGPGYTDAEIREALDDFGITYREPSDIATEVADHLARGWIVGWFQGRCEGGPRALGHRSILANPSSRQIRDRVNDIKTRHRWRPLAPSIIRSGMKEVFAYDVDSPFMIVAFDVDDGWKAKLEGTTHVDGSARPHTVTRESDPLYCDVLDRFEKNTGLPAIVNTSFNNEREPIVLTPADAVRTFFSTGMDLLAIGSFIIEKRGRDSL